VEKKVRNDVGEEREAIGGCFKRNYSKTLSIRTNSRKRAPEKGGKYEKKSFTLAKACAWEGGLK